jgi:hypothetical protein
MVEAQANRRTTTEGEGAVTTVLTIVGVTVLFMAAFALPFLGHWFQCWAEDQRARDEYMELLIRKDRGEL